MSTKTRWRSPLSRRSPAPRASTLGPSAHVRVPSLNASASCHRRPHRCSVSRRLAPVAPGSPGRSRNKARTAGWGPPHACPHRPVPASKPTAGTPGHGPGWRAQVLSPGSLSPQEQMPPDATSCGHVKRPAALFRTPSVDAKLADSDTISAPPAGPIGARPISAGSRQWSAPHPRNPSSCTQMSEPSTHTPHDASLSPTHAQSTCNRGVCTRWATPFRPGAGCQARWPSRWWRWWA